MDILVPISMKNAAKCDTQCELQNSASHQIFERKWRWLHRQHACLSVRGITQHNAIDGEFLRTSLLSLNTNIAEQLRAAERSSHFFSKVISFRITGGLNKGVFYLFI